MRSTSDFRLLNTDLGGFGSKLRTDLRLGFLTQASTEYYRLLSPSGCFVMPRIGILRRPVYLWRNQKRVLARLQEAGGGLTLGRMFNRNLQISAEYQAQVRRWHLVTGADGTPTVPGLANTAVGHLVYDSTATSAISVTGTRIDVRAGGLFRTVASENAPLMTARLLRSLSFNPDNIVVFAGGAETYFGRAVTEPLRFTVGGPLRLSASSIEEYRGTDDYNAQAGYVRRVGGLPSGYGQGLYAGLSYEAAKSGRRSVARSCGRMGVLTLIGVTPVGVLTFGGSVGDAGHRKVFFTFGRVL